MLQQDTPSGEHKGLEVKADGPGSVKRRTSKEDKKVNFAEEATANPKEHLSKRDSQRDLSAPRPSLGEEDSPKSQRKFKSTWKMACDKTKDRTKELLKRWRTLPEGQGADSEVRLPLQEVDQNSDQGWSVHVWGVVEGENGSGDEATWVKRFPSGEDSVDAEKKKELKLTETQKEKLSHFFAHCFDMDRDDIISLQDFESFTERLRHFADWSTNCGEYLILEQVQRGFVESFILPIQEESTENMPTVDIDRLFLSLEDWLYLWSEMLTNVKNLQELPIWLQYLPKVLFRALDKSGDGIINKEELACFYSSVIGFPTQKVNEIIDPAFKSMTSNGDMKLTYSTFRLCFANFLFGRFPNGPGGYIFGHSPKQPAQFPIDYSAMNTPPGDLELYSFDTKSNRSSIVI